MSARRKRPARGVEEEAPSSGDRWLVSYADMLTVLVGLFIVLYAMSHVDQDKYEQLAASLAVGFGGEAQVILNTGPSILAEDSAVVPTVSPNLQVNLVEQAGPQADSEEDSASRLDLEAARKELDHLTEVAERMESALASQGLEGSVSYRVTERGLVVGLVSDELFFVADTAKLTSTSQKVVDALAPVLAGLTNQIMIEGHANILPSQRYPTNWELSADRATQVLRRFVEHSDLPAQRVASVGFGESRPLATNDTGEGLAINRRVDIVILSSQPEHIRELIPVVQQSLAGQEEE